jgi:cation diffusion facilitator family transporter
MAQPLSPHLGQPRPPGHDEVAHRRAANRAVGVSAVGLGVTGAVELLLALVTGSVGLLGDALHNLSDVSTSVVVFIGFAVSKKPPSPAYPYGYERAEDLSGLGVALVIWASAVFAGVESYRKLVNHSATTHLAIGMVGAVLGILGNQAVARYKAVVGRRIQSATLVADAHHSRLDAMSSAGALVGLIAVALGYRWGDPIAGFAVTAFILHVGYEVTSELVRHLMDAVDPELLDAAESAAVGVADVHDPHARGRWTGRTLVVEVEGEIDPSMSLAAAADTAAAVEDAVREAVPQVRQFRFIPVPRSSAQSI